MKTRMLLRGIFLGAIAFLGLLLVMQAAQAGAESKQPLWDYSTDEKVYSVDLSEDGEYLVAGTADYKVYLFDRKGSTPLWNYTTNGEVYNVAISANGEYVVAGSYDRDVYFFSSDNSTPLWNYTTGGRVKSVAISNDGKYITIGSTDNNVYLFDRANSTPLWSYDTAKWVNTVDISSDGEYITAGTADSVYLFHKDNSTPRWRYRIFQSIRSVAISANGEYITAGKQNDKLFFFSRDNPTPIWEYNAGSSVTSVDISADGNYIVAGSSKYKVYFFHKDNSTPLWNYTTKNSITQVSISADGNAIAAASEDWSVYFFYRDDGNPYWSYRTGDRCTAVALSAEGDTLAAGSWDSKVYLFRTIEAPRAESLEISAPAVNRTLSLTLYANGTDAEEDESELTPTFQYLSHFLASTPLWNFSDENEVRTVAISPDGRYLAAGTKGMSEYKLYLFDKGQSEPIWSYDPRGMVTSISFSMDGEYIASATAGGDINIFRTSNSTPLWTATVEDWVSLVTISANGEYVIAASKKTVYLFYQNSSTPLWNFSADDDVNDISISTEGDYFVVGSDDYNIYLFSKNSSSPLWNYTTGGLVRAVSISADGQYIAGGSADGNVYLFHRDNSTPLWSHFGGGGGAESIAISPDGNYIAAGSPSGSLTVYYRDNSTPLWRYFVGGWVYSVSISANGEYIAVGSSNNGKVFLFAWDVPYPIWTYTTANWVRSVALSADGEYLVAGSYDTKLYLFQNDWKSDFISSPAYVDDRWQATFTPPRTAELGPYSFRVGFTEPLGLESRWLHRVAAVEVFVLNPTALIDAVTPLLANESEVVAFAGHGLAEAGVVAYEWRSDLDGLLSTSASFAVSNLSNGTHRLSFRIRDAADNWSGPAPAIVVVNGRPRAHLDAVAPARATEGDKVSFEGRGTDDGAVVAYRWRSSLLAGNLSPNATFNTSTLPPGNHTLYFAVRDDAGLWSEAATASLFINVRPLAAVANDTATFAHAGEPMLLNGSGADADGQVVEYLWESDRDGPLGNASRLTLTNLTPGNHNLSFSVRDDFGAWSGAAVWSLRVNARPVVAVAVAPRVVLEGGTVTLAVSASDSDGNVTRYRYRLDHSASSFNLTRDYNVTDHGPLSTAGWPAGNYTLVFQAGDSEGGWSDAVLTWLYVNVPPLAVIDNVSVVRAANGTVAVTLAGHGEDDETIAALAWRSDLDGPLGRGSPLMLYNLTPGAHNLSLRVQDRWGAWSEWVAWGEPVTVAAAGDGNGGNNALLALLVLVAMIGARGAAAWRYRARLNTRQLSEAAAAFEERRLDEARTAANGFIESTEGLLADPITVPEAVVPETGPPSSGARSEWARPEAPVAETAEGPSRQGEATGATVEAVVVEPVAGSEAEAAAEVVVEVARKATGEAVATAPVPPPPVVPAFVVDENGGLACQACGTVTGPGEGPKAADEGFEYTCPACDATGPVG